MINKNNIKYYLKSIARGTLSIFSVKAAVRKGYGHMKQTESEALEIPNQTPGGDESGLLELF